MTDRLYESMAALSELGSVSAEDAQPLDDDRWELVTELGSGGMGRVLLMYDRWLEREVAVKEPRTPEAAERLAREARVTAGLTHPGVVAVHDVLKGADGTLRYVMPVAQGSSLADHLALTPSAAERRRRFLRPLLSTCQAVAYAHSRGVVHRDLTAANVMIGSFGEVQVIDWGLAVVLGEHESVPPPRAGTRGAMSPEQERGAALDARSDVWSLGALLRTTAWGASANDDDDDPVLGAIVAKATEPDPDARYAEAGALAEDLENYLEGRRVSAYAYRGAELVRLLARAWRRPLIVAAIAFVVILALTVAGVMRIDRAYTQADMRLGHLLVSQARQATLEDRLPEASVLAAHALDRASFAEARGILALAEAGPNPQRTFIQTPPCEPVDVTPSGDVLCVEPYSISVATDGARRWSLPIRADFANFLDAGATIAVIVGQEIQRYRTADGSAVGARETLRVREGTVPNPDGRTVLALRGPVSTIIDGVATEDVPMACTKGRSSFAAALDASGRHWAVVCDEGHIVDGMLGAPPPYRRVDAGLTAPPRGPAARAAAFVGPDRLLVGEDAGTLRLLALDTGEQLRVFSLPGRPYVRQLLPLRGGEQVVISLDDRPPLIFDVARFAPMFHLPDQHIRQVRDDGAGGIVSAGRVVSRWSLAGVRPGELRFDAGIAAIALDPTGRRLAVAHGADVSLVDVDTRRVIETFRWQDRFVKTLDFGPDGQLVASGFGAPDVVSLAPGRPPRTIGVEPNRAKQLVALSGGRVLDLSYPWRLRLFGEGREEREFFARDVVAVEANRDRSLVVVRLGDGQLQCADGVRPPLEFAPCGALENGVVEMAVAPRGRLLFAARPDWISEVPLSGGGAGSLHDDASELRYASPGLAIAGVQADDTWLAAGGRDGSVVLWRHGEPRPWMSLRAADRRVAGILFSPSRQLLITGDWGGRVRLMTLAPTLPAAMTLETRWGITLRDVLDGFVQLSP